MSWCASSAGRPGGVGKLRGVRGMCRGTAPPALRPGQRTSAATIDSSAQGCTVRVFAQKHTSFNLSKAQAWKYFLMFSFHLFIFRNIICSGLSQHNKSMERRGITWLYRFQKQKVILHTMNLYILENLKCQSS